MKLRSLFLDCSVSWYTSPQKIARQIYKDAHYFLEAYGSANGSYDAGVDLLEMSEFHFKEKVADSTTMTFSKKMYQDFNETLRHYLSK